MAHEGKDGGGEPNRENSPADLGLGSHCSDSVANNVRRVYSISGSGELPLAASALQRAKLLKQHLLRRHDPPFTRGDHHHLKPAGLKDAALNEVPAKNTVAVVWTRSATYST